MVECLGVAEVDGQPVSVSDGSPFWTGDRVTATPAWFCTQPCRSWCVRGHRLIIEAQAGADLFTMPGVREIDSLSALQREISGDFTLRVAASVEVVDGSLGDAAGVFWRGGHHWIKACVERLRNGRWGVVTVASTPTSDEALGPDLAGPAAELLLSREEARTAVWFRETPQAPWRFARTLLINSRDSTARLGLFAQAPFSSGAIGTFENLSLEAVARPDGR